MSDDTSERRNWTGEELDLIVADYFVMLNDEAGGVPYNKAEHNRFLRSKIDRSEGSIEFKHQNISAVLQRLGLPRIRGYLPATNYQKAIIAAIDHYISKNPVVLHPEKLVGASRKNLAFSLRHHRYCCRSLLGKRPSNVWCANLTQSNGTSETANLDETVKNSCCNSSDRD